MSEDSKPTCEHVWVLQQLILDRGFAKTCLACGKQVKSGL